MEILKQTVTYAVITLVKDYCKFPFGEEIPTEEPSLFDDTDWFSPDKLTKPISINPSPKYKFIPFYQYSGGSKTRYFYVDEDLKNQSYVKIPFETALFGKNVSREGEYHTTNQKHIKRHYGNPFASIVIVTMERSIKIVNDKVIVRTYRRNRFRDFNCKYFKIRTQTEMMSFNLNNGDINVGISNKKNKGVRVSRFRRNSFNTVENIIGSNTFFKIVQINKNLSIYNEIKNEMNDDIFLNTLLKEIGQYNDSPISLIDNEDRLKLRIRFIDFLVEHKKIKTPNDYYELITNYYPGEVYLKKNDRKLIQSSLDSYGILSKFTNKLLHSHVNIDIKQLALFCSFFGKDYTKHIGNLKPESYKFLMSSTPTQGAEPIKERKNYRKFELENTEKENIIKITNSLTLEKDETNPLRAVSGVYSLFVDHMDMITQVREFDPNFRMRATNYTDFHTEHIELSKMVATIKKGWSTEYVYDNRMVRKVEEPMNVLSEGLIQQTFIPHILKRDEEYSEEGSYMHHCVASYANKEESIVISLRTDDDKDRVTCEFNKKTGECLQERHFCNRIPPEHFTEPLRLLRVRVKKFSTQRLLIHLETKKVRVKINGKEVPIPQSRRADVFIGLQDEGMIEF